MTIEDVNGYDVGVEIYKEPGQGVYRITSTATSDSGATTTIESYTALWDYWALLGNACSSNGDIVIKPNSEVWGNVTLNGEVSNQGEIHGDTNYGIPRWPSEEMEQLSGFYDDQVSASCGYSTLDVGKGETVEIGPCKTSGDLTIQGKGTVTLGGTLYVAGDLTVKKPVTLDLCGQTIFAGGMIEFKPDAVIYGPGCTVAAGDLWFSPKMANDGFIFAISVGGTVRLQPNGDFHGSLAGSIEIRLQPNTTAQWLEPPPDLNWYGGSPIPRIETYTILE